MSTPPWDIIIVGGGIAGLSIAEHCAKKPTQRILVLEQYGAWGGRAATERIPAKNGVPALQYEAGAGRIHHAHTRVNDLVKRFGLHTYPITTDSLYETHPNPFLALFAPLKTLLETLPPSELATRTLYECVPDSMRDIFTAYPYWAEIQLMRADVSMATFAPDEPMGSRSNTDFYGIKEGVDSLTDHLRTAVEAAGVELRNHHRVDNIQQKELLEITGMKNKTTPFHYVAQRVIIATPFSEFSKFAVLRGTPMLKQLAMSPLLRIYAVYPPSGSKQVWFKGLKRTITANPLRHIIPIREDIGLIMISYTDGTDTEYWRDKEGTALETALATHLHELFPSADIPKPVFLKKHDWKAGCTYWLPGNYDVAEASRAAHNPAPNVYVCGESVSQNQAWLEGALESADLLKTIL